MKKYVKPELFYEKFELSQHIASDCQSQLNHYDVNNCSVKGNDYMGGYFVSEGVCTTPVEEDALQDYCYENANGTLFGS